MINEIDTYIKQMGEFVYTTCFNKKRNGFFIECGALDGLGGSNCKFLEGMGWTGINIEAAPLMYNKLKINRPKCINLQAALSNISSKRKFYSHKIFSAYGTLDAPTKYFIDTIGGDATQIDEYEVDSITYQNVIQTYKVNSVDFFSLDVEGHELFVLKDMIEAAVLPKILCVEYGHVGLINISNIINNKGYELQFHDAVNAIYKLK